MPSSDDDVDSFFANPRNPDRSAARPRPAKRRKSVHPPSDSSSDDTDRDDARHKGASSDLEVVGSSSSARGAGARARAKAGPVASTSKHSTAAKG